MRSAQPEHLAGFAMAVFAGLLLAGATTAQAQQRIGEASSVRNQVSRVNAGGSVGLSSGGSVFRNETVRTGRQSSAKLVFLDQTNLAIGPTSSVVLDRFVFSGGGSAQAVSVNLARGVFRFTTGVLDKRAYKINTPVATIGVRGTVLDINSVGGRSRVTLVDNGAALVCVRSGSPSNPQCAELQTPGDSVEVTNTGVQRVTGGRRFSFASVCGSNPGLCSQTQLAQPLSPAQQLEDALCGR